MKNKPHCPVKILDDIWSEEDQRNYDAEMGGIVNNYYDYPPDVNFYTDNY